MDSYNNIDLKELLASAALEDEKIATSRYQSYLSMLDNDSTYRKNNYVL